MPHDAGRPVREHRAAHAGLLGNVEGPYIRAQNIPLPASAATSTVECGRSSPADLAFIGRIAFGSPNNAISTTTHLWFGPEDQIVVDLEGPYAGRYFNLKTREEGHILDEIDRALERAPWASGLTGIEKLSPDDEVTMGLGLVAGLEYGRAVLASGWAPVWVAHFPSAIEGFPILAGIEALTLFPDRSGESIRAAEICAARWWREGRDAVVIVAGEQL